METELSINGLSEGYFTDIVADNVTVNNDLVVVGNTINSGNEIVTGILSVSGSINTNTNYLLNGAPLSTSSITEGTNLYYTDTRARLAITAGGGITYDNNSGAISISATTDLVPQGLSNLYYSDSLARAAITANNGITYDKNTGTIGISANSDDIPQGQTNLYYSDGAARAAITGSSNIQYDKSTGEISLQVVQTSINVTGNLGKWLNTRLGFQGLTPQDYGIAQIAASNGVGPKMRMYMPLNNNNGTVGFSRVNADGSYIDLISVGVTGNTIVDGDVNIYGKLNINGGPLLINGATFSTSNIPEGSNLYYTDQRSRLAITGSENVQYNNSSGRIGVDRITKTIDMGNDLGPWLQASYNFGNDRYGFGQWFDGRTRMFTPPNYGSAGYSTMTNTGALSDVLTISYTGGAQLNGTMKISKNNGDCLTLEGSDIFNGNPATLYFNSGATRGYIQHVDSGGGQFYTSKPLTVNGKLWTYGTLEAEGAALLDNTLSVSGVATFYGKSYHVGGLKSNSGLELVPGDPGKMVYKAYNSTNDVYGFGQYAGGWARSFCGSYNNSWNWKNSMSIAVNEANNVFVDQITINNGKIGMVGYQGFTGPNDIINNLSPYMIKSATQSTSSDASTLKVVGIVSQNLNTYMRTFETEVRNLGISGNSGAAILENQWFQSVNYLGNFGTTFVEYYQTILGTLCYPINNNYTYDAGAGNFPQFKISQWRSNVGERTLARFTYNQSARQGNGGTNYSNICFPQLARGAFYNAYFDPYGWLYPDVYASDRRLKTNIEPTSSILDEYKKIRVVNFDWDKDGENKEWFKQNPRGIEERQVGIIAQDLLALPRIHEKFHLVKTTAFSSELPSGNNATPWLKSNFKAEKEFLTLEKERLPFLNMKAIQEVAAQVEALGGVDLEALRSENAALKAKVLELEQTLEGLILVLKKRFII